MTLYDVIIVGMGAAGCAAASLLCRNGVSVLALEAQECVGGRVYSVPFGGGVVELGAEWVYFSPSNPIVEIASKNNAVLVPQKLNFETFRSDGTTRDNYIIKDVLAFLMKVVDDKPSAAVPLGDHLTVKIKNYIKLNHPSKYNDRDLLDNIFQFLNLFFGFMRASDDWNDLTTNSFIKLNPTDNLSWSKLGYRNLVDILLNVHDNGPGLPNLQLEVMKVVSKITYPEDSKQDVVVTCNGGAVYKAKSVIVTVSLGVLKESHTTLFSPRLPQRKISIIEAMAIGVVNKIQLYFSSPWWSKDQTFFHFVWRGEERSKVTRDDEWMTKIFAASSPLGSDNVLTLWTSGEAAKIVETLPENVVKSKVMELLRKFMGRGKTIPEPQDILRSNWYSSPYTCGSYTYDNPFTCDASRMELAAPLCDATGFPRVLFAGEATSSEYYSTVQGAIDSGFREADRLLTKYTF